MSSGLSRRTYRLSPAARRGRQVHDALQTRQFDEIEHPADSDLPEDQPPPPIGSRPGADDCVSRRHRAGAQGERSRHTSRQLSGMSPSGKQAEQAQSLRKLAGMGLKAYVADEYRAGEVSLRQAADLLG